MILIIYAHPYPHRSYVNRALLDAVRDLEHVKIHSLYELYPDYCIDMLLEQSAIEEADTIVIHHPMQWYNMPSLLTLWFDKVFEHGWAYGEGKHALRGKQLLWAVTTGGDKSHFELGDNPGFAVLSQPLQKTALFCGMRWLPPFVIHNAFGLDTLTLSAKSNAYRQYLLSLRSPVTAQDGHNE